MRSHCLARGQETNAGDRAQYSHKRIYIGEGECNQKQENDNRNVRGQEANADNSLAHGRDMCAAKETRQVLWVLNLDTFFPKRGPNLVMRAFWASK